MINPPDDLLEDLQSALPPEFQVETPVPGTRQDNGHAEMEERMYDHADGSLYDHTKEREVARASVTSNSTVSTRRGSNGLLESVCSARFTTDTECLQMNIVQLIM